MVSSVIQRNEPGKDCMWGKGTEAEVVDNTRRKAESFDQLSSAPPVAPSPRLSPPVTHPEASFPHPRKLLSRQAAFPSSENSHAHSSALFPCSALTWMLLFPRLL